MILGADPLQKFIEPLWTYTAPLIEGEHQHLRDLFVDRYGYVHAVGWLGDLRSSAVRRKAHLAGLGRVEERC
ncbi:MAG: hypothetical protein IPK80_21080 [Nannocystis sp.]|nr:hypothetical protein [Nannocystis sp.]